MDCRNWVSVHQEKIYNCSQTFTYLIGNHQYGRITQLSLPEYCCALPSIQEWNPEANSWGNWSLDLLFQLYLTFYLEWREFTMGKLSCKLKCRSFISNSSFRSKGYARGWWNSRQWEYLWEAQTLNIRRITNWEWILTLPTITSDKIKEWRSFKSQYEGGWMFVILRIAEEKNMVCGHSCQWEGRS